ncbi:MAG: hypothetical protein J6Y44_01315 [Clostridia bacterium]|nr:hypothetical protein [Clostridia bacterium]
MKNLRLGSLRTDHKIKPLRSNGGLKGRVATSAIGGSLDVLTIAYAIDSGLRPHQKSSLYNLAPFRALRRLRRLYGSTPTANAHGKRTGFRSSFSVARHRGFA